MSFKIGSDIELPFEVEEYSVVLGLHAKGVYVTENTSVESEWFVPIFGSKPRSVTRGQVLQKLREAMLQGLEPLSVADVCISDFKSGKKYLTGCTAGLLAWFNERVPTLDKTRYSGILSDRHGRKFVRAIFHASEVVAQQIAALKVELRKKDAAIARLARKLQRAKVGVVDDDSEGECEDESDGKEGDANYEEEETADRMGVESERKQLHEDEEDQTEEDSEEEKQADGEEKQGQEEEEE
ncbi:uncharacterized protein LOC127252939 [Andrographis paniculata]|uniref:uncharacterized protein LOC127252939 n=1 Tax=Andrographis paniculata TaxID=175694 RepID=UPI0021E90095|nr:uncharacterized protein LOC127252939 [Andrographis paniculata]